MCLKEDAYFFFAYVVFEFEFNELCSKEKTLFLTKGSPIEMHETYKTMASNMNYDKLFIFYKNKTFKFLCFRSSIY